jgi:hypothetical protein
MPSTFTLALQLTCGGHAASEASQLDPLARPTLSREFVLVEVPRLVADDCDLDKVVEKAVDDAVGADEQLADLLAPSSGTTRPESGKRRNAATRPSSSSSQRRAAAGSSAAM